MLEKLNAWVTPMADRRRTDPDIERRWRQLDPVFVMGMQRSGTSVIAVALMRVGFFGFGEGHLWLDAVQPLGRILDPNYRTDIREDTYTLGEDRAVQFVRAIAVAIDQFHRTHMPRYVTRWMDKSPGAYAVKTSPVLATMFPRSQFVFVHRSGIGVVHSGRHRWPDTQDSFRVMCRGWCETMSSFRAIQTDLADRCLELPHHFIVAEPHDAARKLCQFVGSGSHSHEIGEMFGRTRAGTSFPEKAPGDYEYDIDWTADEVDYFVATCGDEMAEWGYRLDFG